MEPTAVAAPALTRPLDKAFTDRDILDWLYNYRHTPDSIHATNAFAFIAAHRILFKPQTAIGWAGVICALCERHPGMYDYWRREYRGVIKQAQSIEKHGPSHTDIKWADHMIYRWFIWGNDREPWALLKMAHGIGATDAQKVGTQTAINQIMYTQDNGSIMFEDMRQQMTRLAREFSKMTPAQRRLPFDKLPFSLETVAAQMEQPGLYQPGRVSVQ